MVSDRLVIEGGVAATIVAQSGGAVIVRPYRSEVVLLADAIAMPGPRGADGASGSTQYVHAQPAAALSWTVAHNLGRRAMVTVLSIGGMEVLASVIHLSSNVLQIDFDNPMAGEARCI